MPRAAQPPRLLQSAGFRFALLFVGIFSVAAAFLVAVLWWATAGALDRQTIAAIRTDASALVERYREAGSRGLIEAIEERLSLDAENETIYLLVNAAGVKLAGNLTIWPTAIGEEGVWFRTRIQHDGATAEARVHRRDLPGLRLLVGRDESERVQLRLLLTEGVAWSLGAVLIFAVMGAAVIRRALQQRMRPAVATAQGIAAGDFSQRVPISPQGDEFDRLGATMNAMLDRIAALMAGMRGVADAIAHDLRTPIARARAKLEESLVTAASEDALRAAVEEGIADLDNITRIFQALLRIAEAEAGARRAAFAPLDLPEVLRDAAEFYDVMAEAREQVLQTEMPEHLPMLGDRDLLLQAVANLLDNAIKFTPGGGVVRLTARQDEAGIEIAVCDSGPGLSPEDRARAMDRFFRADASRNLPGSGLGLALVRAVAQLHGGEVMLADAVPGAVPPGLKVALWLPPP
ncbi:HAMP domain-containing sensor histidine kinase [Sediminicoccus sp. KRV36]|uniref:HAMP domain-containing sensor histidine kinase n=1 Tax=Sediminicoccus sp. KRV36 TaxID=3133721 RepID=UPI00200FFEC7|nr:HAMP domain-containing sensor histidine kinase [Sediminicoccus rosea]UPY36468.1 HAMP domain-containing histidine kinase [Sediminicoccus rosea]